MSALDENGNKGSFVTAESIGLGIIRYTSHCSGKVDNLPARRQATNGETSSRTLSRRGIKSTFKANVFRSCVRPTYNLFCISSHTVGHISKLFIRYLEKAEKLRAVFALPPYGLCHILVPGWVKKMKGGVR